VSLKGSLTDFDAPDVFQLIAQQRKTGILEVRSSDQGLQIFFSEGRVLRAHPSHSRPDEALAQLMLRIGAVTDSTLQSVRQDQGQTLEPLAQILEKRGAVPRQELERTVGILTHETIFELFRWEEGSFEFHPEAVQSAIGDTDLGAEQVLLDAVRMKDEWARIEAELPSLEAVPVQLVDVEAFRGRRGAVEQATGFSDEPLERLFMMSDGRRPARRVIDLSRLGVFDGARGLVALAHERLIRLEPPTRTKWTAAPAREARVGSPALPGSLPGLVALAVAAAVSALLWLWPAPRAAGTLAIPEGVLAGVREAAEVERIRTALEVERWVSGGYPTSLQALAEGEAQSLALPEGDRYSYERFSGGYRLFRTYP
jgi:hypothetical protein